MRIFHRFLATDRWVTDFPCPEGLALLQLLISEPPTGSSVQSNIAGRLSCPRSLLREAREPGAFFLSSSAITACEPLKYTLTYCYATHPHDSVSWEGKEGKNK